MLLGRSLNEGILELEEPVLLNSRMSYLDKRSCSRSWLDLAFSMLTDATVMVWDEAGRCYRNGLGRGW